MESMLMDQSKRSFALNDMARYESMSMLRGYNHLVYHHKDNNGISTIYSSLDLGGRRSHSSLPCCPGPAHLLHHEPPLLPLLPASRSERLPDPLSSDKRIPKIQRVKNQQQHQSKPSQCLASSKRETLYSRKTSRPGDNSQKPAAVKKAATEFAACSYLLSPPPSSLPLPTFTLTRARLPADFVVAKASSNVDVTGHHCVDAGMADNLRRILGLQ